MKKSQLLNFFRVTLLLLIFSAFTSSAWAGAGVFAWNFYYYDGTGDKWYNNDENHQILGDVELDVKNNVYIKKIKVYFWKDGSGNICGEDAKAVLSTNYDAWFQNNTYTHISGNNYSMVTNDMNYELKSGQTIDIDFILKGNDSSNSGCGTTFDSFKDKKITIKTSYALKHPWDGGDWQWKELDANNELIAKYGGTCVNINYNDNDCKEPILACSVIPVGEECVFKYNPTDNSVTITPVGNCPLLLNADKVGPYSIDEEVIFTADGGTGTYSWSIQNLGESTWAPLTPATTTTCKLKIKGYSWLKVTSGSQEKTFFINVEQPNEKVLFVDSFGEFNPNKLTGRAELDAKVTTSYSYVGGADECNNNFINTAGEYAIVATPRYSGCAKDLGENSSDISNRCNCDPTYNRLWYRNIFDRTHDRDNNKYGGMLQFDCNNGSETDILYSREVEVCSDVYVKFSAWVQSASQSNSNPIKSKFVLYKGTGPSKTKIDDYMIENLDVSKGWTNISTLFFIDDDEVNKVTIELVNLAPYGNKGNDLLVDDIEFSVCTPTCQMKATYGEVTSTTTINDVPYGGSLSLSSELLNGSYPTKYYKWQYSVDGTNWMDISSASTSSSTCTIKTPLSEEAKNGKVYYRVILAVSEEEAIAGANGGISGCGSYSVSNTIEVNLIEVFAFSETKSDTKCAGKSGELSATTNRNATFTWQKKTGNTWSNITENITSTSSKSTLKLITAPTDEGSVTEYRVIAIENGTSKKITSAAVSFTVNALPTAKFTEQTSEVCINPKGTTQVEVEFTGAPDYTLKYKLGDSEYTTEPAVSSPHIIQNEISADATITLISVKDNNGCENTIANQTHEVDAISPAVITIKKPTEICAGDPLSLPTPDITYNGSTVKDGKWYLDGAEYTAGTAVLYEKNGTLLQYKAISSCGDDVESNAVTITVNSVPTITIDSDGNLPSAICAGQEYQLPTITVTNNGSTVTSEGWYLGATKISLGEGKYSYSGGTKITLDQGKYYTFSVGDKDKSLVYKAVNGCGETFKEFRSELDVKDCGSFEFTYTLTPSTVCIGDEVILTATLTNKSGVDLKDIKLSQSWNNQLIASKDANEEPKAIFVTTGDATPGYDANISKIKNLWVINTLENNESVTLTTTFSAQEGDTFHIYMTESNGVKYNDTNDDITDNSPVNTSQTLTVNNVPSISFNSSSLTGWICAGTEIELPVVTIKDNGSSIEDYGWYLNGRKLTLSGEKYESVTEDGNVVYKHTGKYTFSIEDKGAVLVYKATNECGEDKDDTTITLQVKDCSSFEFTYTLTPSTVCIGDEVILTATLTNKSGVDLKDIKLSQSWNNQLIASKDANEEPKAIFVTTGDATPGYDANISKIKNLWVINTLENNESVTLTTTFSAQEGDTFHIYMTESNGVDYEDNEQNPARKTQYLTVESIPVVSLSATDVTLNCTTLTATITASGAYKYEWSYLDQTGATQTKSASTLALQQIDPEVSSLVTEYTVYGYSEKANCKSEEAKTVKVTEDFVKPTIEIKPLPAVCLPATVDIAEALVEAKADAIKYYADQNLTQEQTDTEVEAAIGAQYYVVGYNDNGCETSIITIPLNIKEVSGDVIVDNIYNGVCPTEESNIIKLSDLVTSDKTSLTFFDKDKNKLTEEPTFDSSKKLAAVTYYITNQESEKCESKNPTEVNLEIFKPVSASISTTTTSICSGTESAVNITVDGTPDFTIVYNNGVDNITETISETSKNITESLTSDRTYKLISVTDSKTCSAYLKGTELVSVTVNPRPELVSFEIEDTDDIICEGTSTNLKANFKGTPDFTFTLQTTKTVDGVIKTETTDYPINDSDWSMEISEAGQYKITKLSDDYCESETLADAELTLTVEKLPEVTLSATDVTLNCTTPTATITASGAYKYEWSYLDQTGATQTKSASTLALQQTDPEVSSLVTEYTVYGYSEKANCKSEEAKTIKVTEDFVKPVVDIKISETADGTIPERLDCYQQNIKLEADLTNNKETIVEYIWSSGSDNNTTLINNPGAYTLQVKGENGCISDVATETIEQNILKPEVSIESYITDPVTGNIIPTIELTCANNEITLEGTITNADQYAEDYPNGEFTYLWSDGATTSSTVARTPLASSPMEYTLIVTAPNGCDNSTDKAKVTITENVTQPVLDIKEVYELCPIDTLTTLTLSSLLPETEGVTYKFYDESGEEIEDVYEVSSESPVTTYYVIGTAANGCQSAKTSFEVDFAKNVDFTLTTSQSSMMVGGNETIVEIVPDADSDDAATYVWTANDQELSVDGLQYVDNLYLDTNFKVTATNRCDSDTQEAFVEVLWPTAFTPHNGNGKNDTFAKGMKLMVFNRFYTKIFEGEDGWDGSINGTMNSSKQTAVPGVYFYSVQLPNGQVKKGTIEIVKVD